MNEFEKIQKSTPKTDKIMKLFEMTMRMKD